MPAADHPVWPIVRLAVLMSAMTAVLWLNASHFDMTEGKAIIQMFLVAGSVEGLQAFLKSRVGK